MRIRPIGVADAMIEAPLSVSISCPGMGRDGRIAWPDEL